MAETPELDEDTVRAMAEDAAREEPDEKYPARLDPDRGEDEFAVGMGGQPEEYEETAIPEPEEPEEATLGDGASAHIPRTEEAAEPAAEGRHPAALKWQRVAVFGALRENAQPLDELQREAGVGMGDLQRALEALAEEGEASEVAPGEWAITEARQAERIEERVAEIEDDIEAEAEPGNVLAPDEVVEHVSGGETIRRRGRVEEEPAKPILGTTPARALVALDITLPAPEGDQDTLDAVEALAAAAVEGIRMDGDGATATYKILSVEKYEATRKLV